MEQGIIINGCVRDTEDISKIDIGVKALSTCPVKPGKAPKGVRGEAVDFAGITFNEGDWIYADAGECFKARQHCSSLLLAALVVRIGRGCVVHAPTLWLWVPVNRNVC